MDDDYLIVRPNADGSLPTIKQVLSAPYLTARRDQDEAEKRDLINWILLGSRHGTHSGYVSYDDGS